ncbi:MAG: dihydroneopterin aldolase [Enterobacteriaceae bacterium]
MNTILIKDLHVFSFIGMHDWEKKVLQKLIFNVKITYKKNNYVSYLSNKYINYEKIITSIRKITKSNNFNFIEDLAEKITNCLFNKFFLSYIKLKLEKICYLPYVKSVGVIFEKKIKKS